MPKIHECYADANGEPICATVNVTPSWWRDRSRASLGPVAILCSKFAYARNVKLGVDGLYIDIIVPKDEDIGAKIRDFCASLETKAAEFKCQELARMDALAAKENTRPEA